MRDIIEYSSREWIKLDPFKYAFKEFRNRVVQAVYNRIGSLRANSAAVAYRRRSGGVLVMAILFETPWIADWLCRSLRKNLINASIVLFDNSRSDAARIMNKEICETHEITYVALPKLHLWNVNWSHSAAMQWIYYNFIRVVKPDRFAFIDHDMIPFDCIDLSCCVDCQPFYGLLRPGGKNEKDPKAWSLWAGYCVFNYKELNYCKLDFLYNFSRGLDTGGGNYDLLYMEYDKDDLSFAPVFSQSIDVPSSGLMDGLQVIDGKWFHVGSVSYAGDAKAKREYWHALDSALFAGIDWNSMVVSSRRSW